MHYSYFARNSIYALAKLWELAGREILFPAYFHGVELEALLAAGVRPRFYPVHDRMRIDVGEVVAGIRPETRAVYLIHYLGFPGPVAEIAKICRDRNLLLIEDCALALLSCLGDRPLGSFGDAAIFCLYKTLPVPNGGALILRRGNTSDLLKGRPPSFASTLPYAGSSLSFHFELDGIRWAQLLLKGMRAVGKLVSRTVGAERVEIGTQHFDHSHAGLAMSRLSHLVLAAQDFPSLVERRRRNYMQLRDRLCGLSPPLFDELPLGVCPLFYPIQVRNKQTVVEELLVRGVQAVNFWSQYHSTAPRGTFPEVDQLRQTVLELPCHQDLTPQAVDQIADEVSEVVRRAK